MELRSLRYFVGVLEAGSFSRAAGSLYVAQPALSAQIKKLEEELGVQLFERSRAGVTPTFSGLQLYEDAQRLLSDAKAMKERMRGGPGGPEGSVTLALPFMLASLLTGPVLIRLRQEYPGIRLFIRDSLSPVVKQTMLDRRADVGLLIDTASVEGLRCKPVAEDSVHFSGKDLESKAAAVLRGLPDSRKAGPSGGASGKLVTIPFQVAAAFPLLLQSQRFTIRRRVEDIAGSSGVALNIAHEHDSTRTIRSLLLSGAGFTFAPGCSLRAEVPSDDPTWVDARVVDPEFTLTYSLALPARQTMSEVAKIVVRVLLEEAHALIQDGGWDARWLFGELPNQEKHPA